MKNAKNNLLIILSCLIGLFGQACKKTTNLNTPFNDAGVLQINSKPTADATTFTDFKTQVESGSYDTVYIKAGVTFNFTSTVNISRNMTIIARTGSPILFQSNSATSKPPSFFTINHNNITINGNNNLTINGNNTSGVQNGIKTNGYDSLTFKKFVIKNLINGIYCNASTASDYLTVDSMSFYDITQKSVVINRASVGYTTLNNFLVKNSTFEITSSFNASTFDMSDRAISLDAGNDGDANFIAAPVTCTNCQITNNTFKNLGVAIARYENVDVGTSGNGNTFVETGISGLFTNSKKYKFVNIENDSQNINVNYNSFAFTSGYVRMVFIGSGSGNIPDSLDKYHHCQYVTVSHNTLSGTACLSYLYTTGVANYTMQNNDFGSVSCGVTPVSFDVTNASDHIGSTDINVTGNTNVASFSPYQCVVKTSNSSSVNSSITSTNIISL